jgi:hypothetical protein
VATRSFVDVRDALYEGPFLERWGTRKRLQRVTIEEHQVGDLVFVLLPLFIQGAHGHIDRVIVQYDVAYYNNYQ